MTFGQPMWTKKMEYYEAGNVELLDGSGVTNTDLTEIFVFVR